MENEFPNTIDNSTKVTELYIWQDYVHDENLTTIGLGAVDQAGNVIFDELVRPDNKWLSNNSNAEAWLEMAHHAGYNASEILLAHSWDEVSKKLIDQVAKLKDVKSLISYNVEHNIPDDLKNKYKQIDVMELFANVIKDPMYDDSGKNLIGYKWQKLSKCLDYYHAKLKGNKAYNYADAIRRAYQKMN